MSLVNCGYLRFWLIIQAKGSVFSTQQSSVLWIVSSVSISVSSFHPVLERRAYPPVLGLQHRPTAHADTHWHSPLQSRPPYQHSSEEGKLDWPRLPVSWAMIETQPNNERGPERRARRGGPVRHPPPTLATDRPTASAAGPSAPDAAVSFALPY